MSRPIVLSNGELHVGINDFGLVHDLYFPYVGFENHAAGHGCRHRIGVWVDNEISWLDENSDEWDISFSYPYNSLIGHITAKNTKRSIILEFDDAVDYSQNALLRNIHVVNTADHKRDVRLFMHQAFAIGDSRSNTDTVQYLPDSNAVLHYRGHRAFIISGQKNSNQYFDQYSMGLFGIEGHEGTFRDAEDGELSFCNVEHGRVDSIIRFKLEIAANDSERVNYWVAVGKSTREALQVHKQVINDSVAARIHHTLGSWYKWLDPVLSIIDRVDDKFRDSFIKSALIIKSQIDNNGAVIASTDTAMLNHSRDAYGYCWPRDGAYVLWPLIRLGYTEEPLAFFRFCRDALHPSGYLMHKFRADGALGSSWQPYIHDNDIMSPPIQEDETALTLFVFAQYYEMHKDDQLIDDFYESMIKPMANFLSTYVDDTTGLPKPSYDLWEEVFLTTTYTTSITFAALTAAVEIAESINDKESAVSWRVAASDIYTAAHKYLYNKDRKAFYKGVLIDGDNKHYDETIDSSSMFGAFMFGLYDIDSEELTNAFNTTVNTFTTEKHPFGIPRYERDNYYRQTQDVQGNWWYITSMWAAQYYIETGDEEKAKDVLSWLQGSFQSTGVMSEQLNPHNMEQLSVAPLTWSHAEFMATILDTIAK